MRRLAAVLLLLSSVFGEDSAEAIVGRIAKREGFFGKGTVAQRYNNPGALVYNKQPGASPGEVRSGPYPYAVFETVEAGWKALEDLVRSKLASKTCLTTAWRYLNCDGSQKVEAK